MTSSDQADRLEQIPSVVLSVAMVGLLAVFTNRLASWSHKALEYPLWAAGLGLVMNLMLGGLGAREMFSRAARSELFLKVGLILLGAGVNIREIVTVGWKGMIQAAIMVSSVFGFTWWLASRCKLDEKLKAVMSTAVSICGVSAAIAAAGSVLAKREHLAYITALVIVTALPLMVLMPYAARAMHLPPQQAGAWFGGNIDTTAAVVGAGQIHSEEATKVASIVKMSQNACIGLAAFLLALYWVMVVERTPGKQADPRVIWERFPKFVLGFILMSLLASAGLFTKAHLASITALRNWAFSLAFICIGLELSFGEFKQLGARPLVVYLAATAFNTALALGVSWVLFRA